MACTVIEAADRPAELAFKQKVSVRGSKSCLALWGGIVASATQFVHCRAACYVDRKHIVDGNHIMDNGGVGRRPRRRQLLHGWTMTVAAVAAVATALAVERLRATVAQATTCTPASTGPEENITAPVWT